MTEFAPPPPALPAPSGANGVVELRVPAAPAFVAVLRSVTAGLAARCDLTLDEIEDLRIAVDEACALLVPIATPAAALETTFQLHPGQLVIRVGVETRPNTQLRRDGFGWTVLEALVNSVEIEPADGSESPGGALTITLTKRRESAEP